MSSIDNWKPDLYDSKLGFVSELGKGVVELLQPLKTERILDLGCGTGDLTREIANSGANVVGMDRSAPMIQQAKLKYPRQHYPSIDFKVADAEAFHMDTTFDAVFSNAALHWMKQAPQVAANVWNTLKAGGRFVAEFGGKGNVDIIIQAIADTLQEDYGVDVNERNPWYFPSIGEYSLLLEQQGFRVCYAQHFDRPTRLEDGVHGLDHWLTNFGDDFFVGINPEDKSSLFEKIAAKANKHLFHDGSWYADYKRLRIVAFKPL